MRMPRNKSQFKSVLTKRQEDGLICDKLAYLTVTSDDPPELQCVTVKRKGLFKCSNCEREWASHQSFVKVDLVNLCLSDDAWNRQGCRRCHKRYSIPIDQWPTPCFKSSWFKEILDMVVTKFNTRKANEGQKSSSSNVRNRSQGPHRTDLCERCRRSRVGCLTDE